MATTIRQDLTHRKIEQLSRLLAYLEAHGDQTNASAVRIVLARVTVGAGA